MGTSFEAYIPSIPPFYSGKAEALSHLPDFIKQGHTVGHCSCCVRWYCFDCEWSLESDSATWAHLNWKHKSALDDLSKTEILMVLKGERLADPDSLGSLEPFVTASKKKQEIGARETLSAENEASSAHDEAS